MIIVCPECSSSFAVQAQMIGDKGRRVRCGKCKYIWFKEPNKEAIQKEKKTEIKTSAQLSDKIPDIANVPALKKKTSELLFLKALAVFAIAAMIASSFILGSKYIIKYVPQLAQYYEMAGIYDTEKIILADVEFKKNEFDNYDDLLINGTIVNDSNANKKLPIIRLGFYTKDGEKMRSHNLAFTNKRLDASEVFSFEEKVTNIPKNATKVVIDIGDKLDLFLR